MKLNSFPERSRYLSGPTNPCASDGLLKIGEPGDYTGEIGPVFRMPRSASVRVRADATVISYSVDAFRERFGTSVDNRVIDLE